jgi:phosphopantothenoylcysteine decarboxylase/phosphopantothenate--cysteine ligase
MNTNDSVDELAGRHVVLGLTGGVAAFKAAEFCRLLTKAGATVQVVMTGAACQIHYLSDNAGPVRPPRLSVYTSQWDERADNRTVTSI